MRRRLEPLMMLGILGVTGAAGAEPTFDPALCADSYEKFLVREFYDKYEPGAPMPIPSRELDLVETKIVSGLPPSQAVGTPATRAKFEQVWRSIDKWGADSSIFIVVTVDGYHAFRFPSKVPITREPAPEAFYSTFADDGNGVHGHLNPDLMGMIWATKLRARNGKYLRTVNFYDMDGDLISGIYASVPEAPVADEVLRGYQATWELIESMSRACAK